MLTVKQVADELGLSVRTLRRVIDRGELAYHKFGRAVRIDPADVTDYKRK